MIEAPSKGAVIVAAGSGKRMSAGKNKLLLNVLGKSILSYTVSAFDKCKDIDEIILVINEIDRAEIESIIKSEKFSKIKAVVNGGKTRQESVMAGLKMLKTDIVIIHDGARCLVTQEIIKSCLKAAWEYNCAACGIISTDTLKHVENGYITSTIDRNNTYRIQTPQAFKRDIIINAHQKALSEGFSGTDDCSLVERLGIPIKFVEGSEENIKVTKKEDLLLAEYILSVRGNKIL
ncbi:MAG: 2-C-methyl-D-erythritol 4-phosphate cytidylyltransferase [Bacillota bacterium]|nr:2-C-methyl-D-erythritol 4-phosphate cytidylyltransferase [Bacillota bacterium]